MNDIQKLLILSASAGAGHNRAAEALHENARAFFPALQTEWIDTLQYTNRVLAKVYEKGYHWIASASPLLWGAIYKHLGKKVDRNQLDKGAELFDRVAYQKLKAKVDDAAPDVLLCTHFLPMGVLLNKRIGVRVYVVVTDFDIHSQWIDPRVSGYFVASEEVKVLLTRRGYPPDRVWVTGIPIHPVFAAEPRRVPSAKPRVLFMSGGLGMGHMEEALGRLLDLRLPIELTIIAGKNEPLRKKLAAQAGKRAKVHGFIPNVDEVMAASDLILTKAGGLTVSECLARRLPMVIFEPIPGQEECNTDYLVEQGAALKCRTLELLDYKVMQILGHPTRLDRMRRACGAVARPRAGRDILRQVLTDSAAER